MNRARSLEGCRCSSQGESCSPSQSRRESFRDVFVPRRGFLARVGCERIGARPSRGPWSKLITLLPTYLHLDSLLSGSGLRCLARQSGPEPGGPSLGGDPQSHDCYMCTTYLSLSMQSSSMRQHATVPQPRTTSPQAPQPHKFALNGRGPQARPACVIQCVCSCGAQSPPPRGCSGCRPHSSILDF
ncbi:hypothetical protein LY78DRAFT_652587 [Colletotrichum sublineola]|nr:hypothetical protein LY78DRAFT_652587 [Colletotrichum sublineola]